MKNFYVISYILSDYLINDVKVEVYYAPAIVDSFYSRKEISELILGERDKTVLDGIFELIRSRTTELNTYEIWHDIIEYKGIELIWKSFFNTEEKKMGVEVLYSRDNPPFSFIVFYFFACSFFFFSNRVNLGSGYNKPFFKNWIILG